MTDRPTDHDRKKYVAIGENACTVSAISFTINIIYRAL